MPTEIGYLLFAAAFVPVLFAGFFLYGWLIESNWVELVPVSVEVQRAVLSPSLRVVHLSDLHSEGFGKREQVALELVRSAKPDIICLTGDYLSTGSGELYVQHARRFIGELQAPFGVYAVPGNLDLDPHPLFHGLGAQLLQDERVEVTVRGVKVSLTGSRFGAAPPGQATLAPDALNVLLQHSPDLLEEASDAGYDLYLAGHTHGGQVRIPGYGAIITMSQFGKRYEAGLYSMRDTWMYVNRGLGLEGGWAPRIRLFCRPEVTVLDVKGGGVR
jgi:predicted MPP superfamily phosphohydrolase